MEYCSRCGSPLMAGARACSRCGATIIAQPVVYTPPVKPKVPGRGPGIAGMILSIAALVYSLLFCIGLSATYIAYLNEPQYEYRFGRYYYNQPEFEGQPFIIIGLMVSVPLMILALSFSASARRKGYRCAMSGVGMTFGLISLGLNILPLLVIFLASL